MICEVSTRMTITIEAHTLDDAEELLMDLLTGIEDHPQVLSSVDPSVRAHRG